MINSIFLLEHYMQTRCTAQFVSMLRNNGKLLEDQLTDNNSTDGKSTIKYMWNVLRVNLRRIDVLWSSTVYIVS